MKTERDERYNAIDLLARKELLLSELCGWLKAKGLWAQATRDLGWKITEASAGIEKKQD